MRHLMIAVALLAFAGLDVIFVEFSDTPSAALTFAVLAYLILLLLSGTAGSFGDGLNDYTFFFGALIGQGRTGFLTKTLMAALIPVVLLLVLAFIPDLDDPLDPSETVQLGSTFAVFWLLMSLALAGVVLGFIGPRTGALQAVLVGGLVVLAQSLISWAKIDASREAVQRALHTWMVWVSICLIGAWVGFTLRQIGDSYLFRANATGLEQQNT